MPREEIKAKLIKSDAYKSLFAEQRASDALTKLGWGVVHGCYYRDHQEQKIRELDIFAWQSWNRKHAKKTLSAQVVLVMECKSADDYHLLFSESPIKRNYNTYLSWIGNVEQERDLLKALNDLQIPQADRLSLFKQFEKFAHTKHYWIVKPVIPKIAPAPLSACAFRETNTKHERDLAASVLWKAAQAVNSAIESFRQEETTATVSDFGLVAEMAALNGESALPYITEIFSRRVKSVAFFHPIIVIESQLWKLASNGLGRIRWCRLERNDSYGHQDWIDVVSYDALEEYLDKITIWYGKQFKRARAQPVG